MLIVVSPALQIAEKWFRKNFGDAKISTFRWVSPRTAIRRAPVWRGADVVFLVIDDRSFYRYLSLYGSGYLNTANSVIFVWDCRPRNWFQISYLFLVEKAELHLS